MLFLLNGKERQYQFCLDNPYFVKEWDFNTALGDTIKEKYESLYLEVNSITKLGKDLLGLVFNEIITSPEISSMFEVATAGFDPGWGLPHPVGMTTFSGTINRKWRLYKNTDGIFMDVILLKNAKLSYLKTNSGRVAAICAVLKIKNFLI